MSLSLSSPNNSPMPERPREKMSLNGVESLNDVELLSVLLNTGYKGLSVQELSAHLLNEFGNKGLLQFTEISDIQRETGLPFVKSCQLLALAEYIRRITRRDSTKLQSPEQLHEYLKDDLLKSSFEKLYIVCLDTQRRVLHCGPIAQGKPNTLQISLASIFHHPIRLNALNFYLAHNHPHGVSEASEEDIHFTLLIKEESLKYGLSFDDHIIVSNEGFYSFALKGIL